MDYQEQYQNYLAQAMAALEKACGRFLPEESEVCPALASTTAPTILYRATMRWPFPTASAPLK